MFLSETFRLYGTYACSTNMYINVAASKLALLVLQSKTLDNLVPVPPRIVRKRFGLESHESLSGYKFCSSDELSKMGET
jgi:hypothetical protein